MARQYRRPTFSRARQRQQQRRRLLMLGGGALGLVILIVAGVLIASGLRQKDQPVSAPLAMDTAPVPELMAEVEGEEEAPGFSDDELSQPLITAEPTPTPTIAPTPFTPTPTPDLNTGSKRALSRPTPTAEGFIPVFSKAETDENIIAITVDDCFQAENLKKIVQTAMDVGGKLTIFPIGENAIKESQSETLRYAWENGFELENHTYTHSGLYNSSPERLAEQVYMQQMALSSILGVEYHCHFLRPKGGDARRDQRMQMYAQQLGYYGIAHWSCAGSTSTDKEIAAALKPGAIYLFHTTNNDWDKLERFIPWAVQQGYQLVTLNEMFDYPANETSELTMPAKDYPVPTLAPYTPVYTTMKKTTYSWYAYLLQQKLIELGYLTGEPDGVYGPGCAEAVTAYQRDHNLEQTGVADPELIQTLLQGAY